LREFVTEQKQQLCSGHDWVANYINRIVDDSVGKLIQVILPNLMNDKYSRLLLTPGSTLPIPHQRTEFEYTLSPLDSDNTYRLKSDIYLRYSVLDYLSRFVVPDQLRVEFLDALNEQLAKHLGDAWDVYPSEDTWVFYGAPGDSREHIQVAVNFAKK
jgi:hypothetical protein